MSKESKQLLIVGGGMATAYLLQALSRHDHNLDITVIGEEAACCYNRVMLSGLLAGEHSEDELSMLNSSACTAC